MMDKFGISIGFDLLLEIIGAVLLTKLKDKMPKIVFAIVIMRGFAINVGEELAKKFKVKIFFFFYFNNYKKKYINYLYL